MFFNDIKPKEKQMNQSEHNLKFDTVKSAWVNERYIPSNQLDLHLEEISRNGFTILENKLSQKDINCAKNKIDEIYDLQIKDIGSEQELIDIGEQGLARNLLEYDDFFLKLITHQDILKILQHLLGEYYTLFQFNGNLNISNLPATSTPWHRDLTFRHFTSSRPISLTAIWILDEFNEENGGIAFLPGSHQHDLFPSFEYLEKNQQKLFAKAGSVIVLDGLFFHRSGFNNSKNRRRICQGMYGLPFMAQQICIPKTLKGKYQEDPFLRQLLGYNNIQQESVLDWRKEKLENKRKNLDESMVEF